MANKSNEIHITRIYDAPLPLVWDAWTDDKQVAQWWGPRGFSLTTHSKELKTGGHWHYTMHGPDGKDYINKTKYLEVAKHQKLIYDHGGNDDQAPLFRVTVEFSTMGERTKMDMRMSLDTPEAAEQTRQFIKQAGGNATWDRLAEYLEKQASGKETFVINRTFDAPIDVMFDVWTQPEHISQWLAPKGFTMQYLKADIRSGGKSVYMMASQGLKMYGRAHYIEIRKPDLLVYTQQFCDENENISRHPLAPTWPETMQTTVRFTPEGADRTRVTITWELVGEVKPEELDTFIKGRTGMTMGWTGSFDKLEDYLAQGRKNAA